MNSMKTKFTAGLKILLSFALAGVATTNSQNRAPDVPYTLQVSADYTVSCHAFAAGVQIYTATTSTTDPTKLVWTLAGPEAVLFDADGVIIGIHYAYAGPTRPGWESVSGSLVVGKRTVPAVTVDSSAIPWLLLEAEYAEGPGVFKRTALIQRVNTTGGLAPATPPQNVGDEVRVPYTAEYFFFRASN